MLRDTYDPDRRAAIEPSAYYSPIPGFPEICIGIFSQRIVEEAAARFGGEVYLFHADRTGLAESVRDRLLQIDPDARITIGWVGAVIGIYTGPGALGLAFEQKQP